MLITNIGSDRHRQASVTVSGRQGGTTDYMTLGSAGDENADPCR